jgi:endo-1,4-beta-xylanase
MLRTETKNHKLPVELELPASSRAPMPVGALRDLLGPAVRIGCALGKAPLQMNPAEQELLRTQFNAITPENCMKPEPIHPSPEVYRFTEADALVAFAGHHQMEVTGHCLVWHQQSPTWMFKDGQAPASRDLVLSRLASHLETVMGRYRGQIAGWDVVNEAVADHGSNLLRDTFWTQTVGDDFVEQAFRLAHAVDPEAKLYYNDFNIELPTKRAKTLTLLRRLLDAGVHLDGVGIQGHWIIDQIPFDDIEQTITEFHQLGLKVMITELDLDIMDRPDCGADVSWQDQTKRKFDPYAGNCPDEILTAHAQQYGQLFERFARQSEKLSRITFWGLHDGGSWLNAWPWKRKNFPLLFDRDCRPKAAFHEVVNRVAAIR